VLFYRAQLTLQRRLPVCHVSHIEVFAATIGVNQLASVGLSSETLLGVHLKRGGGASSFA